MSGGRYQRKRYHKRKMRERYRDIFGGRGRSLRVFEDEQRRAAEEDSLWNRKHPPRNGGVEYWHIYYLSGPRQYAKKATNSVIRRKFRDMIRNADYDEVEAPRGSDYEKYYDYLWTVW